MSMHASGPLQDHLCPKRSVMPDPLTRDDTLPVVLVE
jgi:hypothetical protein